MTLPPLEYSTLCLIVIISFVILGLIFLIFAILKTRKPQSETHSKSAKSKQIITSQDIKAIAGDNVMCTQLDLARAYIEMGKKPLAKQILDHVIKHGDTYQQSQAEALISEI